jgi:hypothetical protein
MHAEQCIHRISSVSHTKESQYKILFFQHPETVSPLGGLGGRLGRQISGGGKFFEKKLKIDVFSGTSRKRN